MKRLKQALSLGMAGVMMTAAPVTAFAASPEFSRSAEEWAKLRDNTIEYDELEGLIQEYNATVQTNNLDLAEFKRKYGDTKDDVSSKYRDMADEIYSSITYPDSDEMTYGMMVGSVVMAEVQAKNMEQQADDNLQDSEIVYLNYKSAEKTLVTVAQSNMISYEKDQLALKQAGAGKAAGGDCPDLHPDPCLSWHEYRGGCAEREGKHSERGPKRGIFQSGH